MRAFAFFVEIGVFGNNSTKNINVGNKS